eukprot:TRINITY_DN5500_c0_g2_i2.p1 TRINITY_DN5500_c0_g2~~TRINITY_DN5500_c0_g2_i2.p1  ORF type:complete len:215 (+),score=50.51 TRINITY_DN5500_c0_g2_i2:272-916(+)
MIILNEKRVEILSQRLLEYNTQTRNYYCNCCPMFSVRNHVQEESYNTQAFKLLLRNIEQGERGILEAEGKSMTSLFQGLVVEDGSSKGWSGSGGTSGGVESTFVRHEIGGEGGGCGLLGNEIGISASGFSIAERENGGIDMGVGIFYPDEDVTVHPDESRHLSQFHVGSGQPQVQLPLQSQVHSLPKPQSQAQTQFQPSLGVNNQEMYFHQIPK